MQQISEYKVARSSRETAALKRLTIEEESGVEKQVQRSCRTRPGSDHQSAIAPSRQRRSSPLSPGLRIGNLGCNLDEKNSTIIFSSVQLRAWLAITLSEWQRTTNTNYFHPHIDDHPPTSKLSWMKMCVLSSTEGYDSYLTPVFFISDIPDPTYWRISSNSHPKMLKMLNKYSYLHPLLSVVW